jgi:hypothetical protein
MWHSGQKTTGRHHETSPGRRKRVVGDRQTGGLLKTPLSMGAMGPAAPVPSTPANGMSTESSRRHRRLIPDQRSPKPRTGCLAPSLAGRRLGPGYPAALECDRQPTAAPGNRQKQGAEGSAVRGQARTPLARTPRPPDTLSTQPPTAPAGRYFWHAANADWNAGESGLMPEPLWTKVLPWLLGSGKLGTPWVRMHPANLSTASVYDALGEPLPLLAPCGRRLRHDCMADWNCGELGLTPLGTKSSIPLDDVEMAESGKLLTPWERMQAAKANALAWAELAPPTRGMLGRAAGPSVVLVVEPVWATPLGELPHAANSTLMAPTAHTVRSARCGQPLARAPRLMARPLPKASLLSGGTELRSNA